MSAFQSSFYFDSAPGKADIFGTLFLPATAPSGLGFVLCSGFGKDAVIFRTQLSSFARELAARGHAALRFDYRGYGDSDGEYADATPETMAVDIEQAALELRRRTGCRALGLLGLRFGATLCALAAGHLEGVERLVLWEPLPVPWTSLFHELRMTIAMQTTHLKDVRLGREQIVQNILDGQPTVMEGLDFNVIHDGFPLSRGFTLGAKEIDLLRSPPAVAASTLLVHVTENAKKPMPKDLHRLVEVLRGQGTACALEVAEVPMLPWVDGRHWMARSPEVFAATLRWLEGCG
jgi:pimeloyl-ACP methyl ester carboxylesterase